MTIPPRVSMNRVLPIPILLIIGLLVIGGFRVDAWAQVGTDVRVGSNHFRELVQHINQYSARVNAHFGELAMADPPTRAPVRRPAVPEESTYDRLAALPAEAAAREAGSLPVGEPAPGRSAVATGDRPPEDPVPEARVARAVVPETAAVAAGRCQGHRLVPATLLANVIRILDACDLRLGHWPTEAPGFYRDYRIPDAIGLPAPGGVAQLLEVVQTHFGMQGRPNPLPDTIDFTYTGIRDAE